MWFPSTLGKPGKPDYTQMKWKNQFEVFMDALLHAKNQDNHLTLWRY